MRWTVSTLRSAMLAACLPLAAHAGVTTDETLSAPDPPWAGGSLWPLAPPIPPGKVDDGPTPTLADLNRALRTGDKRRAEHLGRRIVDEVKWSADRTVAAFALGMLYRERELHNLASEAFTQVRASSSPLAEWGAYYEAEQDLLRGKPWVAIRECEAYQKRWPKGRFSQACERLMARALVATGNTTRAREVAATYDTTHDLDPITEQIELAIARRWTELHPELAVPLLRKLSVKHDRPLTGRVAEELLAELDARGVAGATLPDDDASLMSRAIALRDVKRKADAWDLFQTLRERGEERPAVAAWVQGETARFAWRTHRWDDLAAHYGQVHETSPSPGAAWDYYKALDRGGRFREALGVALAAQQEHGRSPQWRRSHEVVGRTAMLAQDYTAARAQLDIVRRGGGWAGRRADFYAGVSAVLAGDGPDAKARLSEIIERGRSHVPNARYWRAKAYDLTDDTAEAQADRDWLLTHHPRDWYGVLVRHDGARSQGPPWDHKGRWPSAPLPDLPPVPPRAPSFAESVPVGPIATPRAAAGIDVLQALTWPLRAATVPELALRDLTPVPPIRSPGLPPTSYRQSPFFDEADAAARLEKVARQHGDDWPEWRVVHDLARAGLYDLSGPLLSSIYEEWKVAVRSARHQRHTVARKISSRHEDWRPLFYVARDHHHTDRFTYGLWDMVGEPELKAEALRLGWPLAHDHYVWTHARENDVDPYLVLAIMRVESRYDAVAVSRVGARGAMQIMPRTGALLADLQHDEAFLAGDLEDPILSVGYGIYYFGKLLDRFGGAYPLAVASYNGGPFNMSAWLSGAGDLPIDALVEHIPFRETRRYVRRVVASYQTYLDLYGEPGEQIRLPSPPYLDDPSIVDF